MVDLDGGIVRNGRLKGYGEVIKSNDIISFEYRGFGIHLTCKVDNNILKVTSEGGNKGKRDGTYFNLDYEAKDNDLLNQLQKIIEDNRISKDNGYEYEVAGLPEELGDYILVIYKSGEKIWKYSNQNTIVGENVKNKIYEAFYKCAKENNFDFTSSGSNVLLYDDATVDYLQGLWEGIHFGNEYKVIFKGNNIKIYEDGKLIDDDTYTIIEGKIVKDKLKQGIDNSKNRHDYENFTSISTLRKKNDFTLVAYFLNGSYSTCDLLKK